MGFLSAGVFVYTFVAVNLRPKQVGDRCTVSDGCNKHNSAAQPSDNTYKSRSKKHKAAAINDVPVASNLLYRSCTALLLLYFVRYYNYYESRQQGAARSAYSENLRTQKLMRSGNPKRSKINGPENCTQREGLRANAIALSISRALLIPAHSQPLSPMLVLEKVYKRNEIVASSVMIEVHRRQGAQGRGAVRRKHGASSAEREETEPSSPEAEKRGSDNGEHSRKAVH